jgi:putative endonuclease
MNRSDTGLLGERLAVSYLKSRGHRIIERNYSIHPIGEVDIISLSSDGVLVFVEVKTMAGNPMGLIPEDHATKVKLGKVGRVGQLFVDKHPCFLRDNRGWRVDAITVTLPKDAESRELTNDVKGVLISHYENAG